MRTTLALVLVLLLINNSNGQTIVRVIQGKVTNEKNKAIENVHVISSTYGFAAVSDDSGNFLMRMSSQDDQLAFTHVSYKPKFVDIKTSEDTVWINVRLKNKSNLLNEIEINENKRYLVIKPDKIWVYDYLVVDEQNILTLLKDNSRYELRLVSSDIGATDNLVIKKGKRCFLEKDGLGKMYLCSNDSVFQIYTNTDGIQLHYEASYEKYKSMVGPLTGGNSEYLFFKEYALNDQLLTFFAIDRESHKKKFMMQAFNQEVFENVRHIDNEVERLQAHGIIPIQKSFLTMSEMEIVRSIFHNQNFKAKVAGLPVNCPFIQYNNKTYIFDLIKGSVKTFDTQAELSATADLHLKSNTFNIEIDPVTGEFYALSLQKGITYIDRFSIETGKVLSSYKLNNYTFPEKIRFRDGHILFLYSDFNFKKKLFNMPISRIGSLGI